MPKRVAYFAYGVICYAIFLATFLYAIGFVGNLVVPKAMDSALETSILQAIVIDLLLLALFAVQHSVMARPGFKRWWIKQIPEPVERSTYVLFSSVALILVFGYWQPVGGFVWNIQDPVGRAVLYGLFGFGWLLVLVATFLINHFDLFGMRQVWLYLLCKPYTSLKFATPGPYKFIRHPLYLGWLFAFWATPSMSATHLLFALATTAYILIAIRFEERDLLQALGEDYAEYRRQVPMIIPFFKAKDAGRSYANESA